MAYREAEETHPPQFRNINSRDYRDIVDFLSVCRGHKLEDVKEKYSSERSRFLRVVKLKHSTEDYRVKEVFIPQDHPLFRDQGVDENWGRNLPLGDSIQLPLHSIILKNDYLGPWPWWAG